MSSSSKAYLGDGVYVVANGWGELTLTTENGYGPTNTIVLEPQVWVALLQYVEKLKKEGRP